MKNKQPKKAALYSQKQRRDGTYHGAYSCWLYKTHGKEYSTVKTELTALAQELGYETYNDEAVFGQYMAEHGSN